MGSWMQILTVWSTVLWSAYGKSTKKESTLPIGCPYSCVVRIIYVVSQWLWTGPCFSLCFIIPELLPLVMLPSGILNLAFWKITLDWRRAFRSFIVAQREDFNHETQSLETCKFCVLTHLWWRCSPPGLIPHRAIYKSPVISFKKPTRWSGQPKQSNIYEGLCTW